MQFAEEDRAPYFDDVRVALAFALNFKGDTKAPTMSRMMSQVRAGPPQPTKRSKKALERFYAGLDGQTLALAKLLLGPGQGSARQRPGPAPLRDLLDKAHMAGLIQSQFARLDQEYQVVLRAATIQPYERCACRSPCCSGWRKDLHWACAITEACVILERVGDVTREPGKRGLSTQPAMRLALVEQYFTKNDMSLTEMARVGQVQLSTAARHKEWIHAYLKQEEDNAWLALAPIFDEAGITGSFD